MANGRKLDPQFQVMKNLDSFLRNRFKELANNMKDYENSQDVEALHGIRVEIKKIKAVLNLINSIEKGFSSHKHFIPLRNIFRKAGDIREKEVTQQLPLHHQVTGIKDNLVPPVPKDKITSLVKKIPAYIKIVKKSMKKIRPHLKEVHRKDISKIIKVKTKEVKSYLYPKPIFKMIHKVRKAVKEIVYLSEIRKELSKKELAFYDILQDSIGSLHDKLVALEVIKKSKRPSHNSQYKIIKKEILDDKKKISGIVTDFYG